MLIHRYKNKKYYSKTHNRYVKSDDFIEFVKKGFDFTVISPDNRDITVETLHQVLTKLELSQQQIHQIIRDYA